MTPRLVLIALLAGLLAAPAVAREQTQPTPAAKQRERGRKLRDKVLRDKVGLDAAKSQEVERILRVQQTEQRAIRQEMRQARQKLRALFDADSDDQKAYREALDKLLAAQKALARSREKHFGELGKVLTPKEQAKLLSTLTRVQRHMDRRAQVKEPRRGPKQRAPRNKGKIKDPFR